MRAGRGDRVRISGDHQRPAPIRSPPILLNDRHAKTGILVNHCLKCANECGGGRGKSSIDKKVILIHPLIADVSDRVGKQNVNGERGSAEIRSSAFLSFRFHGMDGMRLSRRTGSDAIMSSTSSSFSRVHRMALLLGDSARAFEKSAAISVMLWIRYPSSCNLSRTRRGGRLVSHSCQEQPVTLSTMSSMMHLTHSFVVAVIGFQVAHQTVVRRLVPDHRLPISLTGGRGLVKVLVPGS